MTTAMLYRVAAVLFVIFALGHTVGFLRFTPPTPEGLAVRDAMSSVTFTAGGSTFSYGNFYRGFGLYITLYLAFSAALCWVLAAMTGTAAAPATSIAWLLVVVQAIGFVLSWKYFALPPAVFSAVLALLLAAAAVRGAR